MNRHINWTVAFRHVLLAAQVFSFLVLIISEHITPTLVQAMYCLAVFSSPPILMIYCRRCLREDTFLLWEGAVLVAELLIAFLFVGSSFYGIYLHLPSSILFVRLLTAYAVDASLCIVFCVSHPQYSKMCKNAM